MSTFGTEKDPGREAEAVKVSLDRFASPASESALEAIASVNAYSVENNHTDFSYLHVAIIMDDSCVIYKGHSVLLSDEQIVTANKILPHWYEDKVSMDIEPLVSVSAEEVEQLAMHFIGEKVGVDYPFTMEDGQLVFGNYFVVIDFRVPISEAVEKFVAAVFPNRRFRRSEILQSLARGLGALIAKKTEDFSA